MTHQSVKWLLDSSFRTHTSFFFCSLYHNCINILHSESLNQWKVKRASWVAPLPGMVRWNDCRNIESFASQMFPSSQEPTWCRDVMRRRGPLHNQKCSQVAMDTKWGENCQAKLGSKKRKAWLVSRYLCKRKQCSLFRWAGSCAAVGQLKCVISRERSVCFTNELKATKGEQGRRQKRWKLWTELWTFSQRAAQPSSTHTFSLSPQFNSNYRNWTIYYLAVMGKCAQWT